MPMLRHAGYDGPVMAEVFKSDPEMSHDDYLAGVHKAVEKIVAMAK